MKITLDIDDAVVAELEREAARQGRTLSELVETALRLLPRSQRKQRQDGNIPDLPTFHGGGALVDIADRDALYRAMKDDSARRRRQRTDLRRRCRLARQCPREVAG